MLEGRISATHCREVRAEEGFGESPESESAAREHKERRALNLSLGLGSLLRPGSFSQGSSRAAALQCEEGRLMKDLGTIVVKAFMKSKKATSPPTIFLQ